MIKIRPAKESDLDLFVQWLNGSNLFLPYGFKAESVRASIYAALTDSESVVITAEDTSGPVGFSWLVKKGAFARSAYLRLIAVNPSRARSGAGRVLMEKLEAEYLAPNGLFLLATSTNTTAHSFYRSLGYREVGTIPGYVKTGVDETIFFKSAQGNIHALSSVD